MSKAVIYNVVQTVTKRQTDTTGMHTLHKTRQVNLINKSQSSVVCCISSGRGLRTKHTTRTTANNIVILASWFIMAQLCLCRLQKVHINIILVYLQPICTIISTQQLFSRYTWVSKLPTVSNTTCFSKESAGMCGKGFFYRPDAFPETNQKCQSTEKTNTAIQNINVSILLHS